MPEICQVAVSASVSFSVPLFAASIRCTFWLSSASISSTPSTSTSRVSGRMISLSFAPRGSFCTAMASSSSKNASISVFISAPVAVPFGASFAPASALSAPASAPASALPVSASAPDSALFAPDSASDLFVPDSPRLSFASAFDGEAFNADFFNVASFSAVSSVSSASVSAPICCSESAANACGCHSHVFHINIADNAAAKIRFDFFLIPFSSH